jgi:prepilin peptidase CpaA
MQWFLLAAVVIAAVAAWTDWRTGEIPNWLTYGAIGVAPLAHIFYTLAHTGQRIEAGQDGSLSLVGAVVCCVIPVGLYRANGLGGGDVKLFIALGAWLMWLNGIEAQLWSFCAAALLSPLRLAWDGKLFQTVTNAAYILVNPFLPKARRRELDRQEVSWFRMGPAIFVGTAWTAYLHMRPQG